MTKTETEVPADVPPGPSRQERNLRRQGLVAALVSAIGTCACVVVWLRYGTVPGLLTLGATFVVLVCLLALGAASAARLPDEMPGPKSG